MRSPFRSIAGVGGVAAVALLGVLVSRTYRTTPSAGAPREGGAYSVDSLMPRDRSTLLFLDGRSTMPLPDGRRLSTAEDGVLRIADAQLRLTGLPLPSLRGTIVGAAPAEGGGWWVSTRDGLLQRVDSLGHARESSPAPFPATALWPLPHGGVIAVRSPERFSFEPESIGAPILVALDRRRRAHSIGTTVRPVHELLTTVANSGFAVVRGDTAYFAPMGRGEVWAVQFDGHEIWRRTDSTGMATPEPRFTFGQGKVRVDHQPYNLGLTLGPDGMLYRIRALDTAMTSVALDVIEPSTGAVRATRPLGGPRVTLALDDDGGLHLMDIARLLDAAVPAERESFPSFDLPVRGGGGPARLADFRGKVLLLNFWASWCGPCRTEMPALDSLRRDLAEDEHFALLALNADAKRAQADRFLADEELQLPVAYGGPSLQVRYRYPGLPYTVLVDGEGRVIRRWIGQLHAADLLAIRTLIRAEHARTPTRTPARAPSHHHAAQPPPGVIE